MRHLLSRQRTGTLIIIRRTLQAAGSGCSTLQYVVECSRAWCDGVERMAARAGPPIFAFNFFSVTVFKVASTVAECSLQRYTRLMRGFLYCTHRMCVGAVAGVADRGWPWRWQTPRNRAQFGRMNISSRPVHYFVLQQACDHWGGACRDRAGTLSRRPT